MKNYYFHCLKFCRQILKRLEKGLKSKEENSINYLIEENEENEKESIFKNIHYFHLLKENQIVLNEHFDLGIISLIPVSPTPGLFIYNR
jgi:isopenicillin N synthase-like dioxygenase